MLSISGGQRDKKLYHHVNADHKTEQTPLILSKVSCLRFEEIELFCFFSFLGFCPPLSVSLYLHSFSLCSLFCPCPDRPCPLCPQWFNTAPYVFVRLLPPRPTSSSVFPANSFISFSLRGRRSLACAECLDPGVKMPRSRGVAEPWWACIK